MNVRILTSAPKEETQALLRSLFASTRALTQFEVTVAATRSRDELRLRTAQRQDDVVFLDWEMAEAATPGLVRELTEINPEIRTVVLLPESLRQYRKQVWEAGACNSIPKEYMDQEWLSSVLCLIHRAMEREERLRQRLMLVAHLEPEGARDG